jgi:hypothetical protein
MGIAVALKTRDGLPVATALGYEVVADVTFDTDYAASGGEALDADDLLVPSGYVLTHVSCTPAAGYVFAYEAGKLKAYIGDNNNASDGPLVEAGVGDNGLDGVVTHVRAVASVV